MITTSQNRELARCRDRIQRLESEIVQSKREASPSPSVESALAELSAAMEELRVADEELRRQNDALREMDYRLRAERERYRTLFESAPDAYLVTDSLGTIAEANAAAADLFGRPASHMCGKPLAVYVSIESRRDFHRRLGRIARLGWDKGWEFQISPPAERRTSEPEQERTIWVEAAVQVTIERGEPTFRWLLRDITERIQTREKLEELNRGLAEANRTLEERVLARTQDLAAARDALSAQLRERDRLVQDLRLAEHRVRERSMDLARSNQDLQEFAYIASHDLKEPLRGISSFAEMLLEDHGPELAPEAQSKLETIKKLSQRLYELLDSLLLFSRAGRGELQGQHIQLGEVAARTTDSIAVWLEEQNARVRIHPLPAMHGDATIIESVLKNLIVNGVKYNRSPEKVIEIAGQRKGKDVQISVADNGIGIPPRHLDTVFKMFRRLHGRDAFGGGTGAGLAIVRRLVERHGGRIWLESAPEEGTTFHFTLRSLEGRDQWEA